MKNITDLSNDAKVWIYQADRELSDEESNDIQKEVSNFLNDWSAHGAALDAAGQVLYNRFVVLAVDEEKALASGCSIDKSVHFIKHLGERYTIDFFNRLQVVFEEEQVLKSVPLHEFWARRKAGLISDTTVVFDNLVKNVGEFSQHWKTTFQNSWHAEMWGKS